MNSKVKVFWSFLVAIMLFVGAGSVLAVNYVMNLSASYNGKDLKYEEEIILDNSNTNRTLTVKTDAKYVNSNFAIYWTMGPNTRKVVATGKKSATLDIPGNLDAGTSYWIGLEAVANDPENDFVGNSNIFYVKITVPVETTIEANLKDGNTTVKNGATIEKKAGDKLTVVGTSNKEVKLVSYKWNSDELKEVKGESATITVPNGAEGSTHSLMITAQAEDGKWAAVKNYTVKIPVTEVETTIEANLKDGNTTVKNGATIEKKAGEKLTVVGTSNKEVKLVSYKWNSDELKEVNGASATITVPEGAEGSTHSLMITAQAEDGKWADVKDYTVKIPVTEIETTIEVNLKDGDTTVKAGATIEKKVGDSLTVVGTSNKEVKLVSYKWDNGELVEANGTKASIKVPNGEEGSTKTLNITAQAEDGKWADVKTYYIKIPVTQVVEETTIEVNLKDGNTTVKDGSTIEKEVGDKLTVVGTSNKGVKLVSYKWDNDDLVEVSGSEANIKVPNGAEGSTKTLKITAQTAAEDGKWADVKTFYVKLPKAEPVEPLTGTVSAKGPDGTLSEKANDPTEVEANDEITVSAKPEDNFSKVEYAWDSESLKALPSNKKIEVPDFEEGTTHKLTIKGTLKDGGVVTKVYYITIPKLEGELDIDPWMEENEDAEGLIVSLRNTSDEKKANKNFYMLDEEVIYLIDYKNAGKDIKDEVKLVFNIPLSFEVVESDGGKVDTSKKTITWTFGHGLKKDFADTKRVVIKYTSLSKKSYDSEMIYPQAVIYKGSKAQDYSAVINCIYKDEDTELGESHLPYMYGDKDQPTFRPDDGISRAEGALVLMRIFGVNYNKVTNITTKYSDIDETYLEAQKAITKATELGVINGYPEGTYRPNEKMTRAEFMKIIASYVEKNAEVKGLEVKEDNAVVVYKNSRGNSWAIPYVTLLARINMTSASSSEKDLRIGDTITRAEVAQLCNFYLFRAPAKVTSNTRFDFTDVTKTHKLVGDIVEATRAEHDAFVTEDGKEIIKK